MATPKPNTNPLLLTLQTKCRSLTPFAHEDRYITEQDVSAADLLTTLEKCLFDGIKIKEFHGCFPFWYLLTLLPSPPSSPMGGIVAELASLLPLQTAVSKSRAFIRLALNAGGGCLEEVLGALVADKAGLELFYHNWALLRKPADVAVMIALVRSLKVLRFHFPVCLSPPSASSLSPSRVLHVTPSWLVSYAKAELLGGGRAASASASAAAGGDMSLQTTLERGFGYLFRRLDEAAQELLLSNASSTGSSAVPPLSGRFLHAAMAMYDFGTPTSSGGGVGGGGQRWVDPPFFGSPLSRLLKSDSRCRTSHLSRNLGVPNMLDSLLEYLNRCLHVKGLFQLPAAVGDIQALRVALENEAGVPSHTSPHAVACCLVQWLYELPEPLLGFDMYDAFQACQRDIESEGHRLRNFSLLVEAAPWYNKPSLHRVMTLVVALLQPESAKATGLTAVLLSNALAPSLLRPSDCHILVHEDALSRESLNRVMHTTAACGPVAGVLILRSDTVFEPLRAHMSHLHEALSEKVAMLTRLQAVSVQFLSDLLLEEEQSTPQSPTSSVAEALEELWKGLEDSEQLLLASEATRNAPDDADRRWVVCFPREGERESHQDSGSGSDKSSASRGVALFDELPGGLLAVQSLSLFLKRQPDAATRIICAFASRRCSYCFLPTVSLNLVQMCLVELRLVTGRTLLAAGARSSKQQQSRERERKRERRQEQQERLEEEGQGGGGEEEDEGHMGVEHVSMEQLAQQPVWHMVSQLEAFADIFGVALQMFDDLWKIADPPPSDESSVQSRGHSEALFGDCMVGTRILLNELLRKEPTCSADMYRHFTELRISREPAVIEGLTLRTLQNNGNIKTSSTFSTSTIPVSRSSNLSESKTTVRSTPTTIATPASSGETTSDNAALIPAAGAGEGAGGQGAFKEGMVMVDRAFSRPPCILTASQIAALEVLLPPDMRYCDWRLKYNLLTDGASIATLERQCRGVTRSLLVIQDTDGGVFGAVLNGDEWRISGTGMRSGLGDNMHYYGSGTVKVFSFQHGDVPKIYGCTLANSYFLLCSPDCLGVGGGGDGFAIYLDQDLNVGSSSACETFDSPPLATHPDFVCMSCNVYEVEAMS